MQALFKSRVFLFFRLVVFVLYYTTFSRLCKEDFDTFFDIFTNFFLFLIKKGLFFVDFHQLKPDFIARGKVVFYPTSRRF